MGKATKKEYYKKYKSNGQREISKARKFEKWIKAMVKQSKTTRGIFVSAKNKLDKDRVKVRVSSVYKHEWTFGPFKNVPKWMESLLTKYKDHYKK